MPQARAAINGLGRIGRAVLKIALDTPDGLKRQAQAPGRDEPTMEETFIELIERVDAEPAPARAA